jgi:hypothetical protein
VLLQVVHRKCQSFNELQAGIKSKGLAPLRRTLNAMKAAWVGGIA